MTLACGMCGAGGVRLWCCRIAGSRSLSCAACALERWGLDLVEHPCALGRVPELRGAWWDLPVARGRCDCGAEAAFDGERFRCRRCAAEWSPRLVDEAELEEAIRLGGEPVAVRPGGGIVARVGPAREPAFRRAGWISGRWPEALRAALWAGWVKRGKFGGEEGLGDGRQG